MLKLKLQYFGHLMGRTNLCEKTLMLGKTRREEKGTTEYEMAGWHHQLYGHEFEWLQELVIDRKAWRPAIHEVTKRWIRLSN